MCKKSELLQQLCLDYQTKKVKSDAFKQQLPRDVASLTEALAVINTDMERRQLKLLEQQQQQQHELMNSNAQQGAHITPPVTPQPYASASNNGSNRPPHPTTTAGPITANLLAEIRSRQGLSSLKKVTAHTGHTNSSTAPLVKSIHAVRDIQHTLKTAIERHRRNMLQAEEDLDEWDD